MNNFYTYRIYQALGDPHAKYGPKYITAHGVGMSRSIAKAKALAWKNLKYSSTPMSHGCILQDESLYLGTKLVEGRMDGFGPSWA